MKYNNYVKDLETQLAQSDDKIISIQPFYKTNTKHPAGYVIETNNEVLVCYHGTQFGKLFGSGFKEIKHDIQFHKSGMHFGEQKVAVHAGFKKEFESSKESLYEALAQTSAKEKGVHLTGHSLGAAVAQLAALDLSTNTEQDIKVNKITTFGGPKIFTKDAADLYNDKGLGVTTLRVKQKDDPIAGLGLRGVYHSAGKKITLPSTEKGVHSSAIYRNIVDNVMQDSDITNAQDSAQKPLFSKNYVEPLKRMTKETYRASLKTVSSMKNVFQRSQTASTTNSTPLTSTTSKNTLTRAVSSMRNRLQRNQTTSTTNASLPRPKASDYGKIR